MQEIVEGAKVEFAAQRMNLQTLYEAMAKELEAVKERQEDVEAKGHQYGKKSPRQVRGGAACVRSAPFGIQGKDVSLYAGSTPSPGQAPGLDRPSEAI